MPDLFGNLGDSEPYVPNYLQDEIQFRIDNDLRTIAIPADGVVLGVVGDKNVNHVNFQMPAWYNGFDMSEFQARINFVDPEGNANYYTVNDMTVYDPEGNEVTGTPGENDTLYFTWLVDSYATQYAGTVQFSVRLFKLDNSDGVSRLVQAFNTQINACNVLSTIQLAEYVTQEQMEDILYHYMNELGDVTEELKADIEAKAAATLETIPDDYTTLDNKIDDLSRKIISSPNLFNKESEDIIEGYFAETTITTDTRYRVSHLIPVKSGVTYKWPKPTELGTNNRVPVYTSDGTYIDWKSAIAEGDFWTFTPNANYLMRVNLGYTSNLPTIMICEKNQYPDEYTVYGNRVAYDMDIKDICKGFDDAEYNSAGEAVRKQITDIHNEINAITSEQVNMFNKDSVLNKANTFFNSANYQTANGLSVSHPIRVKAGQTYKYVHNESALGRNYTYLIVKIDGTPISAVSGADTDIVDGFRIITPASDCYIALNIGRTSLSDFMFCEADKYPNAYVPYSNTPVLSSDVLMPNRTTKISDIQKEIENAKSNDIKSVNLFDNKNTLIVENAYVNWDDYHESTGYWTTHPIAVKRGKSYTYKQSESIGTNIYVKRVNADGSNIENKYYMGTKDSDGFVTFIATEDGYVAVNIGKNSPDDFVITEEGLYPKAPVPYEISYTYNPLFGKKIAFNGDSICYGAGNPGGYGKIIARRNNMEYFNNAVSGATIAAETVTSSGNRHWICRTIDDMPDDADYIIIEGGVNDASLNGGGSAPELGTFSTQYTGEPDDTTFCGALESIIEQLYTKYPGKKIGYIAVHKCTPQFSSSNTENSFYYAALNICKKWGVPVCDLNISCPPFAFLTSDHTESILKTNYTFNGDGWHPNEEGYMKYYVPKIEAWLKTL